MWEGRGRRAAACSMVNPQNYQKPKLKVKAAQRPDSGIYGACCRMCVWIQM